MIRIHSFAPIVDERAKILILGSMPGDASLTAGEYYAHKQNAFWRIMAELLIFDPSLPYTQRMQALKSGRIALWDVLQSCKRKGSLDAKIQVDTQIANDFVNFFRRYRRIRHVYFNGTKAESCFRQMVKPHVENTSLCYKLLPSTSPANASIRFESKLEAWRAILESIRNDNVQNFNSLKPS